MRLMNEGLFIWMVIAHVAFLIVPGLIALSYEYFTEHQHHIPTLAFPKSHGQGHSPLPRAT